MKASTETTAPATAARPEKANAAGQVLHEGPKPSPKCTTHSSRPREGTAKKAAALYARARIWIDENPDAWRYMEFIALREAEAGRRFSMKWVAEQTRRKDFMSAFGTPSRFSNTLTAAFARIFIAKHPEVHPFIEIRSSVLDEVGQ